MLRATIQYGSVPKASAACFCTGPKSIAEDVPEPVTNVPTAPIHGAMSGYAAPATPMQKAEMDEIMPE